MDIRKINVKKGDPTDTTLFIIMVFFLAVSLVVVLYANTQIKNVIDDTVLNSTTTYTSINESFTSINEEGINNGFILLFAFLIISMLVSAALIRVSPVFIIIYIITLLFATFVAMNLANTYELLVETNLLETLSSNYPSILWVMQHIAEILVATGVLSLIIIFAKPFGSGGYSSDL